MAGREPMVGALGFELKVFYPIPRGLKASDVMKAQKAGGMPMPKKPDFDNMCKLVADALNGVCYKDDAAITDWSGCKRYGVFARAEVRVWTLEGCAE